MLPVRLLAALAAVLCLSACSAPAVPGVPQAPAASQAVTDEAQVQEQPSEEPGPSASEEPGTQPSSAATDEWTPPDTSGIQARGADSKECKASTDVATAVAELGMTAATGSVTQEMYDKAFTPEVVNNIPADASARFETMRKATKALIGDNPLKDESAVLNWTQSVLAWQYVMLKICS